jgi:hypothetical protein
MTDDAAIGRLTRAVARIAAYTAGRDKAGRSHEDADDGTVVRYLALPDLISMRRAVGRPKDVRRAAELERFR